MRHIMFVCTGNTCRSPMAEYILKHLLKQQGIEDVKVTSCGINVSENSVINEKSKKALKRYGIVVRRFKPKQATLELCRKQHAIICMTQLQKEHFRNFSNVYTVKQLSDTEDIADPFGMDQAAYDKCAAMLYESCTKIVELLKK